MYTVYCHLFPNGKRYVGITRNSPERRFGKGMNYKTCVLLNRAIEKYGWDNVEHIILHTAETKVAAEDLERHYIRLFDSDNPMHGYNMLPGGDVATNDATPEMRHKLGNGQRGKTRTQEEKQKISDGVKAVFARPESNGHFGLKASEETRRKMSESHKARWTDELRSDAAERMRTRMSDPDYRKKVLDNLASYQRKPGDYHCSEETKKILSQSQKGRWIGEKSPTAKPVLQFTKDGEFVKRWACAGEAARAGCADRRNIANCCHHKIQSAGGFVWKFEDDNEAQ